jgi:hypothetical protein
MASQNNGGNWSEAPLHRGSERRSSETDSSAALRGMVEKFPVTELQDLRNGLLQGGLDSWQAAEMISSFLGGRGYGVSRQRAREAVVRMEYTSCSLEHMQEELEKLALVM